MTQLQEIRRRLDATRRMYINRARTCMQNGQTKYVTENWTSVGLMDDALTIVNDVELGLPDTQN